jgi:hypothetical protein
MGMDFETYLGVIADDLVNSLTPILKIKEVTRNTDLLGSYTEAAVRSLVVRIVRPLNVCRGAVLDHPMPEKLRQIDVIIWMPYPAPAIFEVEGFGLVPRSSSFGVMEVKRSNYNGVDEDLESFTALMLKDGLTSDRGGAHMDHFGTTGMSIICVLEKNVSSRLQKLLDDRHALAIFERRDNDEVRIRQNDVIRLINFLQRIAWRTRVLGSRPNYPQIVIPETPPE